MVLRLANFFMRLEARLSYALIGLVQATRFTGGLDFSGGLAFLLPLFCYSRIPPLTEST